MSPSEVVNTAATTSPNAINNLTEEEASRYDRQMRLWGLEAQQRFVRLAALSCYYSRGCAGCVMPLFWL